MLQRTFRNDVAVMVDLRATADECAGKQRRADGERPASFETNFEIVNPAQLPAPPCFERPADLTRASMNYNVRADPNLCHDSIAISAAQHGDIQQFSMAP